MYYTIYKITNTINGKIYIGKHQTKDLNDNYMGSGQYLNRAIKKHGKESFIKEILYLFQSENEMNQKEKELVNEEFCLREDTYNICIGGQGGFSYINKNNLGPDKSEIGSIGGKNTIKKHKSPWLRLDEVEKEQVVKKRNKTFVDKYGKNAYKTFSGKSHSDETKKIMSEKAKNRLKTPSNNSQFGTKWITDGVINKKIKNTETLPEGWIFGRTCINRV